MEKKLIHLISAVRPNFMKIAPLYHALCKEQWVQTQIIHTGQHYDVNMSDAFFRDLMLPKPHMHLGIGSGTHAEQTGKVMIAYEKVLQKKQPDLVIVVGDVNSTVAVTLAAVKLGVKVAHLEAGLRSFDRDMPEEINRIVTDSLADILWTPSPDGDDNLKREGVDEEKIKRVGNIMIDSLEMLRPKIEQQVACKEYGLDDRPFGVVTLHRPSNVDKPEALKAIAKSLSKIACTLNLVFPVHPRTYKNLENFDCLSLLEKTRNLHLLSPMGYIQFMSIVFRSKLIITDSGGIQEESTYLGIPCITLRSNTERPITITQGTNKLCDPNQLLEMAESAIKNTRAKKPGIELWDGKTAQRVVESIREYLFR
ncbi:MAG: UDP-N-acetylglucosamine 2-epimerase (non-hydrolyzing) [Desulfobacteraceae bacterium]|nr:UDP-N-acetylglucosamine 2-epimerase (non-hydrolyzing) [Desulfobacteraceae bacterium]